MREPRVGTAAVAVAVLAACLLAPASTYAWGFRGHRMIVAAAVEALPPPLRTYYAEHVEFLEAHTLDPDFWVIRERGEELPAAGDRPLCEPGGSAPVLQLPPAPQHYLDADAVEPYPFRGIPRDYEAYAELAGDELETWGTAPWTIGAWFDLLVEAMESGDRRQVLCRSAVLSHYVADLAQPLHSTENYNGQLSGLDGVHFRFEGDLVDAYARALEQRLRGAAPMARELADPVEAAFVMIEEGYPAVDRILWADLRAQEAAPLAEGQRGSESPAYLAALWERSGELAARRISHGAEMIASFWFTAWERAGRPALD